MVVWRRVLRKAYYARDNKGVIRSFGDNATRDFFIGRKHRDFANIQSVALRKLDQIDAAEELIELRDPPGNRLESLTGDRDGQHSIRVNDQFRVCFVWTDGGADNVEITDYH